MARPFIESAALLASHGLRLDGPAHSTVWSRIMPADCRYALLPRRDAVTKPIVFDSLTELARSIERRRQGRALQLVEVADIEHDQTARPGVQVFVEDLWGVRAGMIGLAWLNGAGRDTLEAALRRVRTPSPRPSAFTRDDLDRILP